jgi:sulfite exporter TauE/SafE
MLENQRMIAESQATFNAALARYRNGLGTMTTLIGVGVFAVCVSVAARLFRR